MKSVMVAGALLLMLGAALTQGFAQAPARTVWDGVFSAEQVNSGKIFYDRKCASCHGAELTGVEMAPGLEGSAFLANWSGQTLGDLATRIKTTMPANDPGNINIRQTADVIAYMLSFNKFPAGGAVLPGDAQILGQIGIVSEKPAEK